MGIAVHNSPSPGENRAFSLCFSDNWGPLWAPREEKPLLLDDISTGAIDIEVKTPIDMVLMRHAGARVARAGESESGPDGAVVPQPPVRDIAIPPRLHFAHQPKLTVVIPQRDALKVACVRSRLEDRGGRLGAQPPAGSHRISAHSEKRSFLILPIPVCHAVVVQDIENRHMGPPQAEPATVTDVPKLHPRALAEGRRRGVTWPHHLETPERCSVANHPYMDRVKSTRIRDAFHADRQVGLAVAVGRMIQSSWLPVNVPGCQIRCHYLMARTSCRTEDSQRWPTVQRAIILLKISQRRHRLINDSLIGIHPRGIPSVCPQEVQCIAQLVASRQGPVGTGLDAQTIWLIHESRHFHRAVLLRIKDRGNERRIVLPLALQNLRLAQ